MPTDYDVLASTLRILNNKVTDQTFRTTPLLKMAREGKMVEKVDGGSKINNPLLLDDHSVITQLSTTTNGGGGYNPVDRTVKDPLRQTEHYWCDFVGYVAISKPEELSNSGGKGVVRIAEARLKSMRGMVDREIEKQAIQGSSTILTNMESMAGFGAGFGGTTGWFSDQTFGNQTNTIGLIAQSSWTTKFQHQHGDALSDFAANGQSVMATAMVAAETYAPEGSIDLILASQNSYVQYKLDLQTQERYAAATESRLDSGKLALAYNGAVMIANPYLGFTAAGGEKVSMYFLNSSLIKWYFHQMAFFELGDFEAVKDGAFVGKQAMMNVRLQIAPLNLNGLAVVVNAEA